MPTPHSVSCRQSLTSSLRWRPNTPPTPPLFSEDPPTHTLSLFPLNSCILYANTHSTYLPYTLTSSYTTMSDGGQPCRCRLTTASASSARSTVQGSSSGSTFVCVCVVWCGVEGRYICLDKVVSRLLKGQVCTVLCCVRRQSTSSNAPLRTPTRSTTMCPLTLDFLLLPLLPGSPVPRQPH